MTISIFFIIARMSKDIRALLILGEASGRTSRSAQKAPSDEYRRRFL